MSLSHKAVLMGKTYCAPFCGRGCTKAEHDAAELAGRRLAQLCGPGFTHVVFENLGWHGRAISACGRLYVVEHVWNDNTDYTCFLGEPYSHSGRWTGDGKTPFKAIREAIKKGEEELAKVTALLEGLVKP